jgi:hypothetical protein
MVGPVNSSPSAGPEISTVGTATLSPTVIVSSSLAVNLLSLDTRRRT